MRSAIIATTCSLLLIAALGAAPASARPAIQSEPVPLGPFVASDLGTLHDMGLPAVHYENGEITGVAAETTRSIAWVGMGGRVVALDTSGAEPRAVGRSPVLPGTIEWLAPVNGFVLAVLAQPERSAWLVDGRDPTWPRAVRRLALNGEVHAVTADRDHAALVVGDDVLRLDVSDPAAPIRTGRWALGPGQGSKILGLVIDAGRVAVLVPNRILVADLHGTDASFVVHSGLDVPFKAMSLAGDRLFVIIADLVVRVFDIDNENRLTFAHDITLEAPSGPSRPTRIESIAADGDHLAVLVYWAGRPHQVHRFESREGVEPWVELGTAPIQSHYAAPRSVSIVRPEHAATYVLVGSVLDVQVVAWLDKGQPIGAARGTWSTQRLPTISLLAQGDRLAVASQSVLEIEDARNPDQLRRLSSRNARALSGSAARSGSGLWLIDRLWIPSDSGLLSLDVAAGASASLDVVLREASGGTLLRHGDYLLQSWEGQLLFIDIADPGNPTLAHRMSLPARWANLLAIVDGILWVLDLGNAGGTALPSPPRILGIDLALPLSPSIVTSFPLPRGSTLLGTMVHSRLIAIVTETNRLARLSIIDVGDPLRPVVRGNIEFETDLRSPPSRPLVQHVTHEDHTVVVSLTNGRVLWIDVSVPDIPDVVHEARSPEPLTRLHPGRGTHWTTGQRGGLFGLRPHDRPFIPSSRLYLPFALGDG